MAVKFLNGIDVDGSMNIVASDVPNLDASKITSGTFSVDRIPNLSGTYQPAGDYLTLETAETTFQPIGNYLTSVPSEYLTQTEGDARYLKLTGGTLTGTLTLSAVNPRIDFNGTSDSGVDMAIVATPEGLNFIEPEQQDKVHFQILDDTGVNSPFGYQWNGQSLDSRYASASHNHNTLYDSIGSADAVNLRIDQEVFPAIPTNNNQLANGAGYITSANGGNAATLDGIDSTGFVKQLGDTNSPNYFTPSSRRVDPNASNPTNAHYAITTFGNNGNVTGQLATHFQTGKLYSRGYNTAWSAWQTYATESYVNTAVSNLVASAPAALDTLNELAAALGDDANFSTTIANNIGAVNTRIDTEVLPAIDAKQNAGNYFTDGDTVLNMANNDGLVYDDSTNRMYVKLDGTNREIYHTGNFTDSSANWNTAYGWGNHASAGYLTSIPSTYATDAEVNSAVAAVDSRIDTEVLPAIPSNNNQLTNGAGYLTTVPSSFTTGNVTVTGYIKGGGQQLVLSAGEAQNYATGQTAEYIYMNAEQGIQVNSETGNWSGGWAARKTAYLRGDQLTLDGESLTKTNIQNFKTAYGWGDHGAVGYATEVWVGEQNYASDAAISTAIATVTLASLGYTGATNANYITNNNQLTNGAGYLTTSGKAADSNLLDGLDLHTGRNNQANKVVRSNGSGYVDFGWINTTSGNTTSTLTDIYVNTNDGYIRKATPAHFRSQITDGAYDSIGSADAVNIRIDGEVLPSIPTNNNQLTNGAGYTTNTGTITGVSTGTGLDGTASSGSVTITLDLSELADMTAAVSPTVDEVILLDNGAERRKRFSEIFGSAAYQNTSAFDAAGSAASVDSRIDTDVLPNIPTNNNQLTNGAGYITAVPSTFDATSIGIGNKVTLSESSDRGDLLYINSHTSGWGGLQIGNTSNEFIFSLMGNGNAGGIYDDQNGDWFIYWDENAGVQLKHNTNTKLTTTSTGVSITGDLVASGDVTAFSDARVKENVETLPNALESVKQMRGVTYNKIGEEKQSVGVIAQELEEVVPQLVHTDEEGMKSVAYGNITAVLIEALKEQQAQIEELKARLDGLTK